MNKKKPTTIIKKSASTNNLYQSTFMPIFEKATTRIKKLVLFYFFNSLSRTKLVKEIKDIIKDVSDKIPETLHDKKAYIEGMKRKSAMLLQEYDKQQARFIVASGMWASVLNSNKDLLPRGFVDKIDLSSPRKLVDTIGQINPSTKRIIAQDFKDIPISKMTSGLTQEQKLWAKAKGVPYVDNYENELKKYISNVSNSSFTTYEKGKHGISLWQKAELDVRYQKQMENLQNLKDQGVDLCYLSSHPNCSKRCEKWQGKLVSLTKKSTQSGFRVGKVDGITYYSLTDIMAQTDKYGYHNNIISGFNCRHHLIPYQKGEYPPEEFTADEVEKERRIEGKIRDFEREIRKLKTRLETELASGGNNKQLIRELKAQIKTLTQQYKTFCEKYGYAWQKYRIDI